MSSTATPLLRFSDVTAGYEGVAIVSDVNLEVRPGEVVALLGANGAGKTTTLLAASGLLGVMGGTIEVLDQELGVPRFALGGPRSSVTWKLARKGLAHVPEDRGLFYELSVEANLRLGLRARAPASDLDRVLDWFPKLAKISKQAAGSLSGGEQQMLALARAAVSKPKLLLIDEMSLGLAPLVVQQLLPIISSIATDTGAGVLLVEQHVSLVLSMADRAYLMSKGSIVASGTAAELAADAGRLEAGYLGN